MIGEKTMEDLDEPDDVEDLISLSDTRKKIAILVAQCGEFGRMNET